MQLAGLAGTCPPPMPAPAAVAVFAADHGVHAQGVTPWPQEVTAQMVANFLAGGAVVNALAAQVGAEVVRGRRRRRDRAAARRRRCCARKVRAGTADLTTGARDDPGRGTAPRSRSASGSPSDLVAAGHRCLLTGDMGIANTTASAALIAAFTGADPAEVTGRGTGVDDAMLARKIEVVRAGLARHRPDPADPLGVLAAVGGLEHAALAGFVLGAAARRVPVMLDGVIAGAAALVAVGDRTRSATVACIAGHRSVGAGPCGRPRGARAAARWSTWTCAWARAPARCWRSRWSRRRLGCCATSPPSTRRDRR